ncbi:hypothetical protein HUJ04_012966 [Dendroctonus ponderosae]|uniref:TsaA-like domain-containing protein n=1 Tax=Dendroctonus ponderosae TaxID=77166 RepID=J3JWC9_DENPD
MSSLEETHNLQQQLKIARQEIFNLRRQLSKLQHLQRDEINIVKSAIDKWQCSNCRKQTAGAETIVPTSKPPKPAEKEFSPIGIIHSEFPRIRGTPRQPTITMRNTIATLTLNNEVFTNPSHALQDLEDFSHLWIIFVFNRHPKHAKPKVAPPRLNGRRTGVFATRSPHRPCPIGLSLVKIEKIVENVIYFSGVDMVNETPVLDIKPYIPQYDQPNYGMKSNFLQHYTEKLGTAVELVCDSESDEESEEAQSISGNDVRVPIWITESPVHPLTISFEENALKQLHVLNPERANGRKRLISSVLREDPRSTYLRHKLGSASYRWRIEDLFVECTFNDDDHIVNVNSVCMCDI